MPIVARSPSSTTSSSDPAITSCGPDDRTGPCERMVAANPNTTTIPVVLGVVVPLSIAAIILIFLHRRHVRKLRQEDAEDKHKSLDFGMDGTVVTEKRRKARRPNEPPEMRSAGAHYNPGRDRGMSLDLSIANPYILPPELHNSRESLHSLSRSINTGDDKYRATNFIPDDGSLRSPSSLRHQDDASIYTYSSRHRNDTDSTRGLLLNGNGSTNEYVPTIKKPIPAAKLSKNASLAPRSIAGTMHDSQMSNESNQNNTPATPANDTHHEEHVHSSGEHRNNATVTEAEVPAVELDGQSRHYEPQRPSATVDHGPAREVSRSHADGGFDFDIPPNTYELSSSHGESLPQFDITPAEDAKVEIHEAPGHEIELQKNKRSITNTMSGASNQYLQPNKPGNKGGTPEINVVAAYESESDYYDDDDGDPYDINSYRDVLGYDPRRLTMGMRPLPPDDPSDNPEERAQRIRSFYKEYFDETAKPGGDKKRMSYFDGGENYIDDYYGSNNQSAYGHGYGAGSYGYSSYRRGPQGRHRSTVSNGSYAYGGPRAHSSASQRLAGQRGRFGPRPRLPPPQPLAVLPTPAMLKDDSMLPNPMDYAPPQVFKNQRAGTPDNLRGGVRPYSPNTRAFNPLVSSFDDLSVLPSPHQLRKSGTFSGLDFAPPRFAGTSTAGSETGSIRSNRSGMSARQLNHIRAGAYRVSRIPKDVAGTREELASALKPQWNAR